MIEIELPLPHKNLSPNARCHWRAKAEQTRKHRHWASIRTTAAMNGLGWRCKPRWINATVQATFYFKDRRRRDKDNLLASLKSVFDGITDAGIIGDDSGLTHLPVKVEVDKENPRVVLKVTPETEGGA